MPNQEFMWKDMEGTQGDGAGYGLFLSKGDDAFRRHRDITEAGNYLNDALNAYARALEEKPESAEVHARMSKVFFGLGRHDQAEKYARKVAEREEPAESRARYEAWTTLGGLYLNRDQHADAIQALHRAIRVGGLNSAKARLRLYQATRDALSQKAIPLADKINYALMNGYALFTGLLLLPFEPDRLPLGQLLQLLPHLLLGWLDDEHGDGALERHLNLFQRFPGLTNLMNAIGNAYRRKGQLDEARFWLERSIEKNPGQPDAYYLLGRVLEDKEDYHAMADVYERLKALRPNDPHVYCHLGNAYYHANQFREALMEYETAIRLGTDRHWQSLLAQSMATIYADYIQDLDAAIAYYQMACMLEPKDVENFMQLGLLFYQREDYANARRVYEQALWIAPKHPRLYSNLGYLHWIEGNIDEAVRCYKQSIANDPHYEIPLNNLGVIYLDSLGRVHDAIALFEQAISLNEHYALAYYNLGRANSMLNRRLEAASCFQTAQDLNRFSHELDNDELVDRIAHLFEADWLESA